LGTAAGRRGVKEGMLLAGSLKEYRHVLRTTVTLQGLEMEVCHAEFLSSQCLPLQPPHRSRSGRNREVM
jgi:hypothetical protein